MRKLSIPDWFFFFLLIIFSYTFFNILKPYIVDIFLAVILAHLLRNEFFWLRDKIRMNLHIASLTTVLTALVVIIIPIFLSGAILTNEAVTMYSTIRENMPEIQTRLQTLGQLPVLNVLLPDVSEVNFSKEITKMISSSAHLVVEPMRQAFVQIGVNSLHLFVILLLMYFLLLDGEELVKHILYLSPLDDREERALFKEVINITDATLMGTLLIGMIEGVYGAIIFAIFGIPSAIFWGVVIMFLSIVPIVGAIFVMVPMGVFLILSGNYIGGVVMIILAYGGTTITQNYMKPMFVSKQGGPHPAIVLLSTLGGLAYFGLSGFIIGPVFASLFISIWNQFGHRYKTELVRWNQGKKVPPKDKSTD